MGSFVTLRTASTTSGPMVMFGTKRPSITSTWTTSAPAASTARISSARRPKSAERMDGAMRMGSDMARRILVDAGHAERIEPVRAVAARQREQVAVGGEGVGREAGGRRHPPEAVGEQGAGDVRALRAGEGADRVGHRRAGPGVAGHRPRDAQLELGHALDVGARAPELQL